MNKTRIELRKSANKLAQTVNSELIFGSGGLFLIGLIMLLKYILFAVILISIATFFLCRGIVSRIQLKERYRMYENLTNTQADSAESVS